MPPVVNGWVTPLCLFSHVIKPHSRVESVAFRLVHTDYLSATQPFFKTFTLRDDTKNGCVSITRIKKYVPQKYVYKLTNICPSFELLLRVLTEEDQLNEK